MPRKQIAIGILLVAVVAGLVWLSRLGPEGLPPLAPPGAEGGSGELAGPGIGPAPGPAEAEQEGSLPAEAEIASERAPESGPIERSVLTGRLIDEHGVAIPGAEVGLSSGNRRTWAPGVVMPEFGGSPRGYRRGFRTHSDPDGSFRLELPAPDPPDVAGWISPGAHSQDRDLFFSWQRDGLGPLLSGDRDLGEIVLRSAGAISGRVTGPDGEAVVGARIDVGEVRAGGYTLLTESDDSGHYLLGHVPPGACTLQLKAEGYGWISGGITCRVRPGVTTEGIDFRLERIPSVTGIVVDPEGRPVAGVLVTGWPHASSSASTRVETDRGGKFVLRPVQDLPLALGTRVHGYRQATPRAELSWVMPGSRGVRIVLEPLPPAEEDPDSPERRTTPESLESPPAGETLTGWILAHEDVARGGLRVRARGGSDGRERTAEADRQGRFSFADLPPGSYRVWVEDTPSVVRGMLPMDVRVAAGSASSALLDIRAHRPGLVELRVKAGGEAVEGARVLVSRPAAVLPQRGGRTDPSGALIVECPAGSSTFTLFTEVGAEIGKLNVEVAPGRVTGRTFRAEAGRLTLAWPSGYELPAGLLEQEVAAVPEADPMKETLSASPESVPPWRNGRMDLGLMPPGIYLVRVSQTVRGPGGVGARIGDSLIGRAVVTAGRPALCQLSLERRK